jgi:flagellar protein FliS
VPKHIRRIERMYGTGAGINAYKQASVTTADPGKLVLMCYEGAVRNLVLAKKHYENRDYEGKAKALQKVYDIITALLQGLDFERGGIIAYNLNALYHYMSRRLVDGDLKRDMSVFDEVIGIFKELESAWRQITSQPRRMETASYHAHPEEIEKAAATGFSNAAGVY